MDEVRVKAAVLRDAGNRRAVLSVLLDYLGLEGFGIGSALWLYGKTRLKGYKWCPPKLGEHHWHRGQEGELAGRLQLPRESLGFIGLSYCWRCPGGTPVWTETCLRNTLRFKTSTSHLSFRIFCKETSASSEASQSTYALNRFLGIV